MLYKLYWYFQTFFLRLQIKKIGLLSYMGRPLFIYNGRRISIGNKVRIFPGARLEVHGNGEIILEDGISVGQNLHIISADERLVVGKDTTISANVFISNVDHDYQVLNLHILRQQYLLKPTAIGENCFIGYGAVIQPGTILGRQCIIGANSVVKGVFPDFCVIAGVPAKIIKRYNTNTQTWERTLPDGKFLA